MPKRAAFERSRRELSLDVSVGVHILLVVEQSSLESQSRGCAETPTLTVLDYSVKFSKKWAQKLRMVAKPFSWSAGTGNMFFFPLSPFAAWEEFGLARYSPVPRQLHARGFLFIHPLSVTPS